jgi:transcriptional regulator with XRE-family HTH domain
MSLGKNIKIARIMKDLPQGELAKLAHTTQPYLSLIEADTKKPSLKMLQRIADALNTTMSELMK